MAQPARLPRGPREGLREPRCAGRAGPCGESSAGPVPLRPYLSRVGLMALAQSQQELDALASAGLALASAASLADVHGRATALGVAASSQALAAELARSGFPLEQVPREEEPNLERLPEGVRRAAERARASTALLLPVHVDGEVRGSLELLRAGAAFDDAERRLARFAAAQAALAFRAFGDDHAPENGTAREPLLATVGDALAAGADASRTAGQLARLARRGTRATASLLWGSTDGDRPLGARDVRGARCLCPAGEHQGAHRHGRAGTHSRAAGDRRPGDLAAQPRAHARDGGRARRGAPR